MKPFTSPTEAQVNPPHQALCSTPQTQEINPQQVWSELTSLQQAILFQALVKASHCLMQTCQEEKHDDQ